MKKLVLVSYKIVFAVLTLVAVCVQLHYQLQRNGSVINFFSFFTIESNLFAASVLLVSVSYLFFSKLKKDDAFDYLRGAASLYMVVTGVVYVLLLSRADVQTPIPWVNAVLHYIFPVVVLLDWIVDRPTQAISIRRAALWLAYPVGYLAYSLIRGPIAHWYPYPFLNVEKLGYLSVAVNSLVVAAGVILLSFLLVRISRLRFAAKYQ